jgi:integrase
MPKIPASHLLEPLIAEFTAVCGAGWGPVTRRKHAADFGRFVAWLSATARPVTTAALDLPTLAAYVAELRARPKVTGVWRGRPDALARTLAAGSRATLSGNTVNAYMRPLRSLVLWLCDEGRLVANPFRGAARRRHHNPLLPREETPPKGATLTDLAALARGCAGERPIDLRDQAILALLVTTGARNSSVRLLELADVDPIRGTVRFRRAKGGKTLEVALHPDAARAIETYLERGRLAFLGGRPDPAWLFLSADHEHGPAPLQANALSLMLRRRYQAGGGTLPTFGSHWIRHAVATLLVNNGMSLEEVSRYLGHSSTLVTRRYAQQTPESLGARAAEALARAGVRAA